MRTGTETASRVKDLETQISELESGSDRLSKALDDQKTTTVDLEVAAGKKMDDILREVQNKVGG
jgi:homeobox protein cut-like